MNFKEMVEGYIEKDVPTIFEEMGMSSDQIAKQLGISRQMVHKTLKKSLGKMYKSVKGMYRNFSPFEVAVTLAQMLNIDDMKEFYTLLPDDIKKEVEADAKKKM